MFCITEHQWTSSLNMSGNEEVLNPLDPQEALAAKHKQERKELQGKIQSLKKSATKGDKKKKKEVQEEIVRLESELTKRHEEEEAAVKTNNLPINEEKNAVVDNGDEKAEEISVHQRVSKAQKRRQKKAVAGQEREARILEQEVENLQGPRHKESSAITKLLKQRGLALHSILADGNCLYSALEHQLKQTTSPHASLDYKALRKLAADHLRENKNDFLPFLSNPDTGDQLSDEEFDAYCKKVESTTAWGGQIEIRALSNVLNHPIEVIQATGPPMIIGSEHDTVNPVLRVTFHRFMYRLGEHYNSLVPHVEEEDGDENS